MPGFSERILETIDDPVIREETERSLKQRGVFGHYFAGVYRVLMRNFTQWYILRRARWLNFIWGMDAIANYVQTLPEWYINDVLREFGATVGENVTVLEGLRLATVHGIGLGKLYIGNSVFYGRRCIIDMSHEVSFGDHCTLGNDCAFVSHTDFANSPLKKHISPMKNGPVRIGRGAFIGSGTMIAHSTNIGECSIIGANSFVDKHIPPYTFAAGTPAKVLAHINRDKVPAFDTTKSLIVPGGTTPDDFDYDDPRALKIPENCGTIG